MNKPLTVAVLGCEHCHIRGNSQYLLAHSGIEVTEVWGREEDYVAATAQKLGAHILQDPADLRPADLAIITSDTRDHKMLVEACVGKVRAVHVDKPLGLNTADACAVERLSRNFGDMFAVGFFARLNPLMLDLQARVEAGEIGALKHLSLSFGHTGRLDGWLDDWPMFGKRSRFGYGSFGDIAAQAIDVATLLAGELDPKACVLAFRPDHESDVGGSGIAVGASGALVRILASAEMTGPRFDIRADGEKGSLWLRGREMGLYKETGETVLLRQGEWSQASDGPAALVAKLLGESHAPYASAEDGLYVNRMLDRFMELAR